MGIEDVFRNAKVIRVPRCSNPMLNGPNTDEDYTEDRGRFLNFAKNIGLAMVVYCIAAAGAIVYFPLTTAFGGHSPITILVWFILWLCWIILILWLFKQYMDRKGPDNLDVEEKDRTA